MNILYLLIPLSLILAAAGIAAFFWAVRSGQFDDLNTPAMKILDDDDKPDRFDRPDSLDEPLRPLKESE